MRVPICGEVEKVLPCLRTNPLLAGEWELNTLGQDKKGEVFPGRVLGDLMEDFLEEKGPEQF